MSVIMKINDETTFYNNELSWNNLKLFHKLLIRLFIVHDLFI